MTALDLVGPLQAFQIASHYFGRPYRIEVCALTETISVTGNLHFSNLLPYRKIKIQPDDTLIVCGCDGVTPEFMRAHKLVFPWIRNAWLAGATVCSVCTGAFLLAEAGILDGLACATHFADCDELQRRYPRIKVRKGVLFVQEGKVFTSAGVASGIDLAIHLIGLRHGDKVAFQVARSLVIYMHAKLGGFPANSVSEVTTIISPETAK